MREVEKKQETRACHRCKQVKPLSAFPYSTFFNVYLWICMQCENDNNTQRGVRNRGPSDRDKPKTRRKRG